ncbi:MAG TPA: ATPase domain-containing protein, partial [Polyangia bacterium]|nr:ATPase domain-containing protein [Polyangia bacterium]
AGALRDATTMLTRLIDHLKLEQITGILTSLTKGSEQREETEIGISSLIDTWLLLRSIELGGERNRGLYVLKSRGMPHSNQIREFVLTARGIDLLDVYVGNEGVLTGSMRVAQEARVRAAEADKVRDADSQRRNSERRRRAIEAQIAALRAEFDDEEDGGRRAATDERDRLVRRTDDRAEIRRSRRADAAKARAAEARPNTRTGARN